MADSWFELTFGSKESDDYAVTRESFDWNSGRSQLHSKANGKTFDVGPFECVSLRELAQRVEPPQWDGLGGLRFENLMGDARQLHADPGNHGCVFQVASQFNCLEMLHPDISPEDGITCYVRDPTQVP